jgi:response regulator RpfG family c-di-GMP phosphodiesterase
MVDRQMEEVLNVVMAEDDNDDFEILADAIRQVPVKIFLSRAENGVVLMKLIHEKIPDLLFLDIILPQRDGRDCIREIRSDKKFDGLPIIVYTSLKDLETVEFCYRWGTNIFIHKPQSYSDVAEIVRKIFSINWKKLQYYPSRSEFVLNP